MKLVFLVYNHVMNGLKVGAEIVVFIVFLLIVSDVFLRLAGIPPSTYTLGIVEYCLLWFTMLAAPWLVRVKGHVFIDAFTQLLPPSGQRVLAKISYLICICASLVFGYFALTLTVEAFLSGEMDIRGEDMPMWLLLVPMPVSFLMISIEFARYLIGIDSMYGKRTQVRENV